MAMFTATVGSVSGLSSFSHLFDSNASLFSSFAFRFKPSPSCLSVKLPSSAVAKSASVSANAEIDNSDGAFAIESAADVVNNHVDSVRLARSSADWKAARTYNENGYIHEGRVEGFNGGGLLVRFYSLVGFLPFPQLSPSHYCKEEPHRSIHEIAKGLVGLLIPVKVIQTDEENKKLIFSEKEANWTKFSQKINIGDIFPGRVGSVEDYGAFVHLQLNDGLYHLTGLVHVSEVSWDFVQDVRDVLNEGDEVRVKVINIDQEKSRITLSIKQLEEDPLLETLDKVISQDGQVGSHLPGATNGNNIEPLTGLESILNELLQENGVEEVKITRQGFEKRVVSQDLQLWLSNTPPSDNKFTLLARAGRQVQEIQLTTFLDQKGIKKALQQVLERVP